MNWKAAILLFVIFFASAVTIVATTFTLLTPNIFGSTETFYGLNFEVQPLGDPIDSPIAPM